MTNDNGWPDPQRPGVPLNPERDGWHWLAWDPAWPEPAYWDGEWSQSDTSNLSVRTARYIGPLLTPTEVAAREAAAAEAMREAIKKLCDELADVVRTHAGHGKPFSTIAAAIDALPLPAPGALDRVREEAWREGMKAAERIADAVMHQAATCAREPDLIPNIRREYLAQSRGAEDVRDAIRARMEEAWREGMEAGHRDALRWAVALQQIQQAAAAALKRAPDSELFALLHRTAASALASDAGPTNEAAIRARMEEGA